MKPVTQPTLRCAAALALLLAWASAMAQASAPAPAAPAASAYPGASPRPAPGARQPATSPSPASAKAAAPVPARAPAAILTMADQPVRLIRGTAIYKAGNGAGLYKDDILETGAAGAHVEAGRQAILALGPNTRVCLQSLPQGSGGALQVALLQGWIKLMTAPSLPGAVSTGAFQVTLPGGSVIVQSQSGKEGLFVEDGGLQGARFDANGKPGAQLKLAPEQYAAPASDKPQLVTSRPPREFVTAMPDAFRDRLAVAPPVPKAGKVAPVKEREADFADVGDWLKAPAQLRKGFAARFKPRLADPAFRRQVDQHLGHTSEWKPVVNPAAAHSTLF